MRAPLRTTSLLLILLLAACPSTDDDDSAVLDDDDATTDDDDTTSDDDDSALSDDDDSAASDDDDATTPEPPGLPTWTDAPCNAMGTYTHGAFQSTVDRWASQDDLAPWEPGRTVFVGSSSMRLWTRLQEDFSEWAPIQRGFGGSRLWDVVEHSEELITRHDPQGVVIFAGTNDINAGLSAVETLTAYRCLVERIADELGDVPIGFIAVTPTPARWSQWPEATALNDAVEALADEWPDLHFFDPTDLFLATGSPPDASLFVSDGLHLSPAGYALWTAVIRPQLASFLPGVPPAGATAVSGTRLLIDLGPSNADDGAPTSSPDSFGHHWNNWHPMDGEADVLPGEHIGALVDTTGAATTVRLSTATNVTSNGIANGGLTSPDSALLGDLAVGTATQDYLWRPAESPAGLTLDGLDPSATYTLRLFASRATSQTRTTRYTVSGGHGSASTALGIGGTDIGANGHDGNTSDVAELTGLQPDDWGRLHLDVAADAGDYHYLGVVDLEVE